MNLLYYISGHGYGHISRASSLLTELLANPLVQTVHLSCERHSFYAHHSPKLFRRPISLDVGVMQKDSLSMDILGTFSRYKEWEKQLPSLVRQELSYIQKHDIDLILSDSASLPFPLAVEARIPSLFLGNFTWDFIYSSLQHHKKEFLEISEKIRVEYSFANKALVLPFACPMNEFYETEVTGLLGRKPTESKEETRKKLGWDPELTYFLFSFGAYGLEGKNFDWDNLPSHWKIVATGVPGFSHPQVIVPSDSIYYPNLVQAVDAVLTKPGYGILAETYFGNTPILYTDRGEFAEYPYLVKAMEETHHARYITGEKILSFSWEDEWKEIQKSISSKPRKELRDGVAGILHSILEYS